MTTECSHYRRHQFLACWAAPLPIMGDTARSADDTELLEMFRQWVAAKAAFDSDRDVREGDRLLYAVIEHPSATPVAAAIRAYLALHVRYGGSPRAGAIIRAPTGDGIQEAADAAAIRALTAALAPFLSTA